MNNYPNDEELARWIEHLEKEPLYAPAHLKEEILKRLPPSTTMTSVSPRQDKIQLFSYSMKIAIGMTAALIMLFVMPKLPMFYRTSVSIDDQSINTGTWFGLADKASGIGNGDAVGAIEGTDGDKTAGENLYNRAEWQSPDNHIEGVLQKITDAVNDTSEMVSDKFNQLILNNQSFVQEEL